MNRILAAASAALGDELDRPVDLGGSTRSQVLRCEKAGGGTVVVKAYQDASGFAAEAAGLAIAAGSGPDLLAVDRSFPLIVMSDFGAAPSLADLLLSDSPQPAAEGLLTWVRTYARIAVAGSGRRDEWERAYAAHARPGPRRTLFHELGNLGEILPEPPPGLDADLAALEGVAERYPVFSPGDICPDNNLLTSAGMRVLDFEGAGYHSAFLEAAYMRMPFSTCWCVFRLPPGMSARLEEVYRREVMSIHPDLADDVLWETGVRHAMATWILVMTWILLARAREQDRPMHPARTPVPTERQLLRYRWTSLLDELDRSGGDLPAVREVTRTWVEETADWDVPDLPRYPAFATS
ncbi:hypothetical protein [Nonomuraea zeae]|uniref:Aminoglycoside phosphotransferase domain-containing protein n=1 Tax=Nonomuraea zeae TaxID=1642303 RepID=A0A5S4G499_9ACTN|nr:hypothetical protein [Nonomuraea zeae]TMR27818.1 hypothetical protein ETD85_37930 [Nonomuraea zeae]